ncbi:MAG: hypothetical protein PHN98_00745 [Smithellaceae bacterium]|nr:hypothetical protein [Smithellaceae bacterium]
MSITCVKPCLIAPAVFRVSGLHGSARVDPGDKFPPSAITGCPTNPRDGRFIKKISACNTNILPFRSITTMIKTKARINQPFRYLFFLDFNRSMLLFIRCLFQRGRLV